MFANPLYCGQDPFICKGPDGMYYSVAEGANAARIDVYASNRLTVRGKKTTVFKAFESGKSSADLWAPEMWYLQGKWYIYYAGAEGAGQPNWSTHRMFVLESENPTGPYRFCGELNLGERMSIDATVMELPNGQLYLFYMGRSDDETLNCLYMAKMKSPTEIDGEPVLLTKPELPWESDICEGPFPVIREDGISVMYSANAAHLPEYCISQLFCNNPDDILNPNSWTKQPQPFFSTCNGYIGPGHACIVASPDNTENWLVFHSKNTPDNTLPGGWDRVINILPISIDENAKITMQDIPEQGTQMATPSGERNTPFGTDYCGSAADWCNSLSDFCYARTQPYQRKNDILFIDGTVFPSAECKLLTQEKYADVSFSVDFSLDSEQGTCGILLRADHAFVGVNAWQGYAVLMNPKEMQFVRCNGEKLTVLQTVEKDAVGAPVTIRAVGDDFRILCQEKCIMDVHDNTYREGKIGFFAPDGVGVFGKVHVTSL